MMRSPLLLARLAALPLACAATLACAQSAAPNAASNAAPNAAQNAAQSAPRDDALTLYGGYRDGGSFRETGSDKALRLDGATSWALSFDKGLDGARQLQLFVSYQRTDLGVEQSAFVAPAPGATAGARVALPMKVMYFHLGGTNFFDGPIGQGPYLVGGLGATLFKPEAEGYSDELRPSLNLGLGYQIALGDRFALRAEARGYFTLVDSSGGLFCSGGCLVTIKGDGVTQGEVTLGLSYRF
jgi:opacity protein-like surface antigen